jgi:hypothetical protein
MDWALRQDNGQPLPSTNFSSPSVAAKSLFGLTPSLQTEGFDMHQNLAEQLREGTKHSHTAAENTAFMKCFLKGTVEQEPFRKLLANHR